MVAKEGNSEMGFEELVRIYGREMERKQFFETKTTYMFVWFTYVYFRDFIFNWGDLNKNS